MMPRHKLMHLFATERGVHRPTFPAKFFMQVLVSRVVENRGFKCSPPLTSWFYAFWFFFGDSTAHLLGLCLQGVLYFWVFFLFFLFGFLDSTSHLLGLCLKSLFNLHVLLLLFACSGLLDSTALIFKFYVFFFLPRFLGAAAFFL